MCVCSICVRLQKRGSSWRQSMNRPWRSSAPHSRRSSFCERQRIQQNTHTYTYSMILSLIGIYSICVSRFSVFFLPNLVTCWFSPTSQLSPTIWQGQWWLSGQRLWVTRQRVMGSSPITPKLSLRARSLTLWVPGVLYHGWTCALIPNS